MTENGDTHRERIAVLARDRRCTECHTGQRSVSVITDAKGTRGVCARCHVMLTTPETKAGRWGVPAAWGEPD